MSVKKHVAATSDGLFEIINRVLKEKGISTAEFPLSVRKLQLDLKGSSRAGMTEAVGDPPAEKKCKKWGSELKKMQDPVTKETIVQLVQFCEELEEEDD